MLTYLLFSIVYLIVGLLAVVFDNWVSGRKDENGDYFVVLSGSDSMRIIIFWPLFLLLVVCLSPIALFNWLLKKLGKKTPGHLKFPAEIEPVQKPEVTYDQESFNRFVEKRLRS